MTLHESVRSCRPITWQFTEERSEDKISWDNIDIINVKRVLSGALINNEQQELKKHVKKSKIRSSLILSSASIGGAAIADSIVVDNASYSKAVEVDAYTTNTDKGSAYIIV